jgi:hypothetical protein
MELAALISALLSGVGLLGVIKVRERPTQPLQTVTLSFGSDVNTDVVQAMIATVAGLHSNAMVSVEAVSDADGIRHYLRAEQATLDTIRGQWRALLPSLRLDQADDLPAVEWRAGAILRLGGREPILRTDAVAEASAAVLGALQPLGHDEALLWRVMMSPATRPQLPETSTRHESEQVGSLLGLLSSKPLPGDHIRALRGKYAGPVVSAVVVVGVRAGHPKRAAHLLSRLVSVARSRRGGYGGLVVRKRSERQLAHLLVRRSLRGGDLYSPAELAPLLALPIDAPQVAGLSLGTAPVLMPSRRIPTTGRVLAASTWPGNDRVLAQPIIGGLSHSLYAGPSGVGKSALILNLTAQEIAAGRGVLIVDGKGDLAADTLTVIPQHRQGDVIYVDPGWDGPVPGLRLFGRGQSAELTADLILGILGDLFADSWGPLSQRWLRAGLVLLAGDPSATLGDFPFVFSHDAYRRRLVSKLDDPLAEQVWSSFEAMGAPERAHQLAAPLGKIDEIIGRKTVRAVLAQSGSDAKLDMREVLRSGKIVIVSLSPGQIGAPAGRLLGALIIHELFGAVQARSALIPERRTPFSVFVDEPKVLGDVSRNVPLDSLYELARGMGVGLTLSVQSLTQLPAELRAAATTNASTVVAFRQSAADSRIMSAELPGTSSEGLQNLGKHEVIMRIGLGPGEVTAPVSGRTFPPPKPISDPETVRRASAERYGTDPAQVDAALAERHKVGGEDERPIGRSRRSS